MHFYAHAFSFCFRTVHESHPSLIHTHFYSQGCLCVSSLMLVANIVYLVKLFYWIFAVFLLCLQECEFVDDVRILKPMFKQRLAANSKAIVITDIGLFSVCFGLPFSLQ